MENIVLECFARNHIPTCGSLRYDLTRKRWGKCSCGSEEAVAELVKLRDDLANARRLLENGCVLVGDDGVCLNMCHVMQERDALRAENAEMREALEPFAEEGRSPNNFSLPDDVMISPCKYTDCKRAAFVLDKYPEVKK